LPAAAIAMTLKEALVVETRMPVLLAAAAS
jgi:hypothetical protein